MFGTLANILLDNLIASRECAEREKKESKPCVFMYCS